MRLLTTVAFDKGKEEDTFGARDEDWQVYIVMGGNDDEESDWDEAELTRPCSRLQPSKIGVDQAGFDEMCEISIRRLSSKNHTLEERMTSLLLMTGRSCLFPGMAELLRN
ncbi:hypothetical protein GIB67_027112 [Kingdonia uniflora]|uniref:Uncharacterized protein n=1 Tax=Kingdonia uniflora TaxID=39325 RepID=A0A7J7P1S9_9MAGN|nr:hypothetical protein GIB67_027112 [Kingdonia uniflora]